MNAAGDCIAPVGVNHGTISQVYALAALGLLLLAVVAAVAGMTAAAAAAAAAAADIRPAHDFARASHRFADPSDRPSAGLAVYLDNQLQKGEKIGIVRGRPGEVGECRIPKHGVGSMFQVAPTPCRQHQRTTHHSCLSAVCASPRL